MVVCPQGRVEGSPHWPWGARSTLRLPGRMAQPVPAAASQHVPLVLGFATVPKLTPILCQHRLATTAPRWPSSGSGPPVTPLPPHCPRVRPRRGWGQGRRPRSPGAEPGLPSGSPSSGDAAPAAMSLHGAFYGCGKDFSHHPGRGAGWRAGRRPLAVGCETGSAAVGTDQLLTALIRTGTAGRARALPPSTPHR